MNYFFTSDQHFYHNSIIKYCNRPFSSIEEMNEKLIENHNSIVSKKDTIYMLGDLSLTSSVEKLKTILERLNGSIHFIYGNHDSRSSIWNLNDLGLIKSCQETLGIRINNQYIWLSHFAHRVWNRSHNGSWHFYGHSHNKLPSYGLSFDVGVDANNYFPLSFDEAKNKIEQLKTKQLQLEHGIHI